MSTESRSAVKGKTAETAVKAPPDPPVAPSGPAPETKSGQSPAKAAARGPAAKKTAPPKTSPLEARAAKAPAAKKDAAEKSATKAKPPKAKPAKSPAAKANLSKSTAVKGPAAKKPVAKSSAVKTRAPAGAAEPGDVLDRALTAFKREIEAEPADSSEAISILRESLAEDAMVLERGASQTPGGRTAAAKGRRPAGKAVNGRDLAALVWAAADRHKVVSPIMLDLTGLSPVTDYFYIAHAETSTRIKAIADDICRSAKKAGRRPLGQEGLNLAEATWILIDLGEVVAHLFLPESRGRYDLESFWADAPRLSPEELLGPARPRGTAGSPASGRAPKPRPKA